MSENQEISKKELPTIDDYIELTDTFEVWKNKFNNSIDKFNIAIDNIPTTDDIAPIMHSSDTTKYGAASGTEYGHVKSDEITTKIIDGVISVKDIAINGDTSDLASNRGQIGSAAYLDSPNIDEIINSGVYAVSGNITGTKPTNLSIWIDGIVYVYEYNQIKFQEYIISVNQKVKKYIRSYISEFKWNIWQEVATDVPEIPVYKGATESKSGVAGLVPAAKPKDINKALLGNSSWGEVATPTYVDEAISNSRAIVVNAPEISGNEMVAVGYSSEFTLSATTNLLNAEIKSFMVSINNGPEEEHTASGNTCTINVSVPEDIGNDLPFPISAYAIDNNGNKSLTSTVTPTTTLSGIDVPRIISPVSNSTINATATVVVMSPFTVIGSEDTQTALQIQVLKNDEIIYDSEEVSGTGSSHQLNISEEQDITGTVTIQGRYKGNTLGWSSWGKVDNITITRDYVTLLFNNGQLSYSADGVNFENIYKEPFVYYGYPNKDGILYYTIGDKIIQCITNTDVDNKDSYESVLNIIGLNESNELSIEKQLTIPFLIGTGGIIKRSTDIIVYGYSSKASEGYKYVTVSNNYTNISEPVLFNIPLTAYNIARIIYIESTGYYIALCNTDTTTKLYKSTDLSIWEEVATTTSNNANSSIYYDKYLCKHGELGVYCIMPYDFGDDTRFKSIYSTDGGKTFSSLKTENSLYDGTLYVHNLYDKEYKDDEPILIPCINESSSTAVYGILYIASSLSSDFVFNSTESAGTKYIYYYQYTNYNDESPYAIFRSSYLVLKITLSNFNTEYITAKNNQQEEIELADLSTIYKELIYFNNINKYGITKYGYLYYKDTIDFNDKILTPVRTVYETLGIKTRYLYNVLNTQVTLVDYYSSLYVSNLTTTQNGLDYVITDIEDQRREADTSYYEQYPKCINAFDNFLYISDDGNVYATNNILEKGMKITSPSTSYKPIELMSISSNSVLCLFSDFYLYKLSSLSGSWIKQGTSTIGTSSSSYRNYSIESDKNNTIVFSYSSQPYYYFKVSTNGGVSWTSGKKWIDLVKTIPGGENITTANVTYVQYVNGYWVAVIDNTNMLISKDALSWEIMTIPKNDFIYFSNKYYYGYLPTDKYGHLLMKTLYGILSINLEEKTYELIKVGPIYNTNNFIFSTY